MMGILFIVFFTGMVFMHPSKDIKTKDKIVEVKEIKQTK